VLITKPYVQALNCDSQSANTQQLTYAYTAAASHNTVLSPNQTPFNLFVSPDFMHYSTSDPTSVAGLLKPWLNESAQFQYEGKPFVSSFMGQGVDWDSVRKQVGMDLYVIPYYPVSSAAVSDAGVDGLFSW